MTVSGQSGTDLTLTGLSSTSTLTFTTDDLGHSAQSLTVKATDDADGADDSVTLTHTGVRRQLQLGVTADLDVTIDVDDDRGIGGPHPFVPLGRPRKTPSGRRPTR